MNAPKSVCPICGSLIEPEESIQQTGWISDMTQSTGPAHFLCAARLSNERAYKSKDVPWDCGCTHPALVQLVEKGELAAASILEPGFGMGDNSLFLASRGFSVTGVELSTEAAKILQERAERRGLDVNIITGDFLSTSQLINKQFHYVFERSFLQTLPSNLRTQYLSNIAQLLKSNGVYFGIIRGPREGSNDSQPHSFSEEDIRTLFSDFFQDIELGLTVSGQGDSDLDYWLVRAQVKS